MKNDCSSMVESILAEGALPLGSGIRQSDAMGLMKESGLKSNNTEISAFEDIRLGVW